MDERLALLLSPIISAYRPHDDIPTREQLGDDEKESSFLENYAGGSNSSNTSSFSFALAIFSTCLFTSSRC